MRTYGGHFWKPRFADSSSHVCYFDLLLLRQKMSLSWDIRWPRVQPVPALCWLPEEALSKGKLSPQIWRLSLDCFPTDVPIPVGSGWRLERSNNGDNHLAAGWVDGRESSPKSAVLQFLSCKCRRSVLPCRWLLLFSQWLKCTDLCRLKEYQNRPEEVKDLPDLNCTDDESDDDWDRTKLRIRTDEDFLCLVCYLLCTVIGIYTW